MYLLGFDEGTSSVKASLINAATGVCAASDYFPKQEMRMTAVKPGWAEQDPHVIFCGSTNIIERYFAALDVHVLPSYREGFGSVIIEAEAMEVPIITTAIPGPLESMSPDVTGLSVPKQDAKALCEAMVRLYKDVSLRESFGKAGRQYVAERFEVERFYTETLADRKKLLGDN